MTDQLIVACLYCRHRLATFHAKAQGCLLSDRLLESTWKMETPVWCPLPRADTGTSITRKEALKIARQTLEQAEQERTEEGQEPMKKQTGYAFVPWSRGAKDKRQSPRPYKCPACDGWGQRWDRHGADIKRVICTACKGEGVIWG